MGKLTSRSSIIRGATLYIENAMTNVFSQEYTDLIITGRIQAVGHQEVGEIILAGGHCTFFQANYILIVSGSKTAS